MEHDDWNQPGQRTWAHWLGLIFNLVGWATFVTIVTLVLVGALSPHLVPLRLRRLAVTTGDDPTADTEPSRGQHGSAAAAADCRFTVAAAPASHDSRRWHDHLDEPPARQPVSGSTLGYGDHRTVAGPHGRTGVESSWSLPAANGIGRIGDLGERTGRRSTPTEPPEAGPAARR